MSGFVLAHPLWSLAGLVAVALAEWLRRRRPLAPALPHAFARWFDALPRSPRERLRGAIAPLRLLLLALIAVAAAGPVVAWKAEQETRRGVDVLVALDASQSMTVALPGSFASTRFDAARAAAIDFARGRPDDRIGLVTFARYGRLACPLTWDHELFEALLTEAHPVAAGSEEDQTAIGVALAEGVDRLAATSERARVLVLVTDGANNVDLIVPLDGARLCKARGVRVYTITIGALGADGMGARFGTGTAPPDLALLQQIAELTGGRAYVAADRVALTDAWRAIDSLEQGPIVRTAGLEPWPAATPLLALALIGWIVLGTVERAFARSLP
jgi:Ca-activated chloride channel family protein